MYLVGSFDWRERSNAVRFDALGQCALGNETVTITGALIEGNVPDTSLLRCPSYSRLDSMPVMNGASSLLAWRAGEIITWPHEALSSDWNAVWAVSLREMAGYFSVAAKQMARNHRLRLTERPNGLSSGRTLFGAGVGESKPTDPQLSKLWRRYQEYARNV